MRFPPYFTWGASSLRSERRLGSHNRIGIQSGSAQNQDITKQCYSLRCDKNRRRLVGLPAGH
jgi:hypothetical protein